MTLYEIAEQYEQVRALMDDPETPPEVVVDTLEAIEGDLSDKVDAYGALIREADGRAAIIDREVKRLLNLKANQTAMVERLKRSLENVMKHLEKKKLDTERFHFSIAKNPPRVVILVEEREIPKEFMKQPPAAPDKAAIKEAILAAEEAGKPLAWAKLEASESLRMR